MRIDIDIDDKLLAEALRLTGLSTEREAVDRALRLMVRLMRQELARALRGKLVWEGDLNQWRQAH